MEENANGMGRKYVKNLARELLETPITITGVQTETVECVITTENYKLTVEKRPDRNDQIGG